MSRPQRLLAAILPLALMAACNTAAPTALSQLTTVTTGGITFSYPKGWSRTQWGPEFVAYAGGELVAAVSNQEVRQPCHAFENGWTCGQPVDQMQPVSTLVEWWVGSFMGWTLEAQPGSPITVDGLPAKLQDPADPNACPHIGADSAMSVDIERPNAPGNYYTFVACFKGPGVPGERSEALAILRSGRFKPDRPWPSPTARSSP
jgi:hypothetical protein